MLVAQQLGPFGHFRPVSPKPTRNKYLHSTKQKRGKSDLNQWESQRYFKKRKRVSRKGIELHKSHCVANPKAGLYGLQQRKPQPEHNDRPKIYIYKYIYEK